jgi:hypothetical protein
MNIATVAKQFTEYENQWIAISESDEKIVASGENAFEAIERAKQLGYQETILYRVPTSEHGYISGF